MDWRELETTMTDGLAEGWHRGAQVWIGRDGRTELDAGFGEGRPGEAMGPDDLAVWASSTKPVVALALARFWERGRFGLDDRVADHLPAFAQGGKEAITIRHLLTHTGGFRQMTTGWPDSSWDEIVATVCAFPLEPRWVPGEKAGYHLSSSWFVLGELLRRFADRPFHEAIREQVFEPLEIEAWIGLDPLTWERQRPRMMAYEDRTKASPRPLDWTSKPRLTRPNPGSNGCGPIRSLGRVYEALRRGGSPLLTPQTVEALLARHRVGLFDQTFKADLDWGLGFIPNSRRPATGDDQDLPYHYGRFASSRTVGHSGYRSSTGFLDREHGLVVAIAFNGTPGEREHRRRMRATIEAVYRDLGLAG